MKDHNGIHRSLWVKDVAMSHSANMPSDFKADIGVIGAGIAGLSVAYALAREGKCVTVIEADRPGTGQTARTTAHLSWEIDDRLHEVERIRGTEECRLAVQAHRQAIATIASIVEREKIDCDFAYVRGYLAVADGKDANELDRELATARRIGADEVHFGEGPLGKSLVFPNQARFHPLKYLNGLRKAFLAAGGHLVTGVHVADVSVGPTCLLHLDDGRRLEVDSVVVATNSPITNRVALHTKMHPYLTYAIALEIDEHALPDGLFWDTAEPYHYVRLQKDGNRTLAIVGGGDEKTGQADAGKDPYAELEHWARAKLTGLGAVRFRWSGQVMETLDGLAFIGRNPLSPKNVYVACGDSGMGLTHGVIAGMLIPDLILGRENAWTAIFDPARKPVKTASEYVTENTNMAYQYRDYFTSGDVQSTDDIPNGAGAVVREGLLKVAAYRDKKGNLHRCAAVCPHLGALVRWNDDEKVWECPAHGSRFAAEGACIQGPAVNGLVWMDDQSKEKSGPAEQSPSRPQV